MRAPEKGETPLSLEELCVLFGRKRIEKLAELDEIDMFPPRRRVLPAGTWGVFTPGLRRAQPFDGLTQ